MFAKLLPLLAIAFFGITYIRADEPAHGSTNDPPVASAKDYGGARGTDKTPAPKDPSDEKATAKTADAAPEEISRWVKQLDSDEYWTREDATKRLFDAGAAAVAALSEAAKSPKLEVSTRAVGVLARFLELDQPQIELAAETVLEEIAAGRVTSVAARAEVALEGYRGSQQERALAKLQQLGASVATSATSTGEIGLVQVTIGEGWRGSVADLAALKRIAVLDRLSIYVGSVNDGAVKYLEPLGQLGYLDLFGTGITDEGVARLKSSLVNTTIDRRKGGLLGVSGDPNARGGGCLVATVQAGTAADKAGLQAGDVIIRFEGKEVTDFTGLTKLISAKGGGETVELEIERQTQIGEKIEKQRLTKKATLDQWRNRMALNVIRSDDVEIIIGR